jgi:exonuclease III
MGNNNTQKTTDCKPQQIKCIQVKLKHSKAATANLMKIVEEDQIDIICIQEPYTFQSKVFWNTENIQNLKYKRTKKQGSRTSNK